MSCHGDRLVWCNTPSLVYHFQGERYFGCTRIGEGIVTLSKVYPLDSSFASRVDPAIRPSLTSGRTEFTYYPGMVRIPEGSAPNFKNKSWAIAAEVTIPKNGCWRPLGAASAAGAC